MRNDPISIAITQANYSTDRTSVQEELGRPGRMIGRKVSRESSAFVSSISG